MCGGDGEYMGERVNVRLGRRRKLRASTHLSILLNAHRPDLDYDCYYSAPPVHKDIGPSGQTWTRGDVVDNHVYMTILLTDGVGIVNLRLRASWDVP